MNSSAAGSSWLGVFDDFRRIGTHPTRCIFGVTESLVTEITPDDPKSPFPDLASIQFDFQLAAADAADASGRVGADPSKIVKNA